MIKNRICWNQDNITKLRELVLNGSETKAIADIFKTNLAVIRTAAAKFKIKLKHSKLPWSHKELILLKACVDKNMTLTEIRKVITTRKKAAISEKMSCFRMGIYKNGPKNSNPWTKKDITELINMKRAGKSYSQIAKELKRTRLSVSAKYRSLGLTNKPHVWTINDDKLLIDIISKFPDRSLHLIKDISKIMGFDHNLIYRKIKKLGYSSKLANEKEISYQFVKNLPSELKLVGKILCRRLISIRTRKGEMDIKDIITREQLLEKYLLQKGLCFYSGIKLELVERGNGIRPFNLSVDRIDSTLGYFPENVVLCCHSINIMKQRLSIQEFLDFCEKILSWSRKRVMKNNVATNDGATKELVFGKS